MAQLQIHLNQSRLQLIKSNFIHNLIHGTYKFTHQFCYIYTKCFYKYAAIKLDLH